MGLERMNTWKDRLLERDETIAKQAKAIKKLERELAVAKKYWAECREKLDQVCFTAMELADHFDLREGIH